MKFSIDSRDIQFVLFEQLKAHELNRTEKFADYGEDEFRAILDEAHKLSREVLAPAADKGEQEAASISPSVQTVCLRRMVGP